MKPLPAIEVIVVMTLAVGCGTDVDIGEQNGNPDGGLWPGVEAGQCGNGFDDNDNGFVDEGCPCMPGEVVSCWPGEMFARGRGQCGDGSMICPGSGEFSTWSGVCHGATMPAEEVCNGVDDDCNGTVDEGCPCSTFGEVRSCGAIGMPLPCRAGEQVCGDGTWSACDGEVLPEPEVCGDGVDNNCNGLVDEGCGCVPEPEICGDGFDNDCDGLVDEDCDPPDCTGAGEWELQIPVVLHSGDVNSSPGGSLSGLRLAVDPKGVIMAGGIRGAKLRVGDFEAESLPSASGGGIPSNFFILGAGASGNVRFGYSPVLRRLEPAGQASASVAGLMSDGKGGFWASGGFTGLMTTAPGKEYPADDSEGLLIHGDEWGGLLDSRAFGRAGQGDAFGAIARWGADLVVVSPSGAYFSMDNVPILPPSGNSRAFIRFRPESGSYAPSRIDYVDVAGGGINSLMVSSAGDSIRFGVGGAGILDLAGSSVGIGSRGITALLTPQPSGYAVQSFVASDGYYTYGDSIQLNVAGDIVVSGQLRGTVSFGGEALSSGGAAPEDGFATFVAVLGSDGSHRWSRALVPSPSDPFHALTGKASIADDGTVYFAGRFGTQAGATLDLGAGPVTMPAEAVVFAAFDSSGALKWSKVEDHSVYKVGKVVNLLDVAADGCGGFYVTGSYWMGTWAKGAFLRRVVPGG